MVIIGADHAGFDLKNKIKQCFIKRGIDYIDITDHAIDLNDDYVDIVKDICFKVLSDNNNFGIAICGTGIGISIACNKIKGIRAGVCYNKEVAKKMKEDNNCNVICFGGREENDIEEVMNRIDVFMNSTFKEGRHERRLKKVALLEEKFGCIR